MKFEPSVAEALKEYAKERGLSLQDLREAFEEALLIAYKKQYGGEESLTVRFAEDLSEVKVLARKTIVETVENPALQIALAAALEVMPEVEVGHEVEEELVVTAANLGRLAAQVAKQAIPQKLRDVERRQVLEEYRDRVGEVITGVVQRLEKNNVIIKLGRSEAVLSPNEQIPGEVYRVGDRLKLYLVEIRETPRGPQVVLSRGHAGVVQKLFELEIPEIAEGTVQIRAIAREPGYRTKMAVISIKPNVDPVGACIGARGSRIQMVVQELKGEKIDVIRWSDNIPEFVAAALSPAKVISVVSAEDDERKVRVIVPDSQLSLAIGREGQNVRLAAKLTLCHIDIESESHTKADVLTVPT
ncbi:MAG: transcription termination/antitermination protein NusA [Candidatus Sericytochromatia bacterium]|nr:transcription termination/antitermination protein NusA [Candidatus Sericytochromatia bacterium]